MTSVNFYHNTSYSSAVEWKEAESVAYPNITVCNPAFFNKTIMKRKLLISS